MELMELFCFLGFEEKLHNLDMGCNVSEEL